MMTAHAMTRLCHLMTPSTKSKRPPRYRPVPFGIFDRKADGVERSVPACFDASSGRHPGLGLPCELPR
jgi:hypothetical protein